MATSFELNRQAVLGGSNVPGLSNSNTKVSGSLFEQNRQAVLSAKPTTTPTVTSTPVFQETSKPVTSQPNIFEKIGSSISSGLKQLGSKIESTIPGGFEGAKQRLANTKVTDYFLPTNQDLVGQLFRKYVGDTFKEGAKTAQSFYQLTPAYKMAEASQGRKVTLVNDLENALNAGLGTLSVLYRTSPAGPILGSAFGALKSSRKSTQKVLSGESLTPQETTGDAIYSALTGTVEQPGLGAVVTDNPVAQKIIDIGFMATMISKPFVTKKLDGIKLKSQELTKVANTLGVAPNAPMSEVQQAYKTKIVDYKDVFAGRGTAEEIAKVKELNDAYNIMKKTGVFQRQLAGLFGKVKLDDINTVKPIVPEKPLAIPEKIGREPKIVSPSEARSIVLNSDLENTDIGKSIIKASLEADSTGGQIVVTNKPTEIRVATAEDISNLNKKLSEANTKKTVEETLAGNREVERLNTPEKIDIVKNYNKDIIPSDATPETKVKVSRASVEDIKPGDHVVFGETGAEKYLTQRKDSQLFTKEVPLKDLVLSQGLKSEAIYAPATQSVIPKPEKTSKKVKVTQYSVKEPDKYYWFNNDESKYILAEDAKPVEIQKGLDTFVSKINDKWVVTDSKAGMKVGEGDTRIKAINNAKKNTKNYIETSSQNKEYASIDQVVERSIKYAGLSPRYTKQKVSKVTLKTSTTSPEAPKQTKKEVAVQREAENKSIKRNYSSSSAYSPKNFESPSSKTADGSLKEIVKQSDIAKALSEKLDIPIRNGKFRHAGALGIYKHGPKVARVKSGGLPVVFHEVAGHFLDDNYKLSPDIPTDEIDGLLSEYNTSKLAENKRSSEAFAEFMRYWLTGQDEKLANLAPKFMDIFQKRMESQPEVMEVLTTARNDYKRWQDQPATAKVLSQISIGQKPDGTIKDKVVSTIHDLYTSVLDDLHPLSEFSNLAKKKGVNLPAIEDPYILARNLRGWTGKAELFLNKGTFGRTFWKKENGKYKMDFKGKSYSEIMAPIEKAGLLDEFRVYLVSQRIVNDLAPRGIKTGISVEDAKLALEELEKQHPEFKTVAEERRTYKDSLLDYAQESGLIGTKALKKIKALNKYHVPFYRVMEESQQKFLGKSKFGGNLSSPIKKIKGSEREIIDPLESDVKDTYAIINASERNNIGVAMANLASRDFELGRLFEKVDAPMKATKVGAKEVLDKILKEVGEDEIEIPEDVADMVVTIFRPTQDRGPNMLNVNLGDKKAVYQVDPDLFKAIQGLNVEDMGTLLKIISTPAKLLRAGATLSPDFTVRNPFRDQFSAYVYSKHGFTPGIDMIRGMFELFKKGDVYNLWKAGGGEHAMMVSLDRKELQKTLKEVLGGKKIGLKDVLTSPVEILRTISEFGEAGTRLGEMKRALAKVDPVESAFATREITLDFARIGAKTRAVNAITAFWNANVQGTDKMIRSFKTRPYQTLFKTLMGITLPSVLLYLANRDDPRWKEIPMWQKNLFWIVMTKDHIYRIPKPFELGMLFGSAPERALEFLDSKDPKVFDDLQKTIVSGFTPGFLPTGLIPIIENITNYSFFTERPIVSRGKENLPPEAQVGTYTSEVARLLGQSLNYSPSKVDNLIQGYSGGLGKYIVSGMDKVLEGTGISSPPPAPAKELEDLPVIKAFMIRKPIGTGSESVNRVYDMYGKATTKLNYVKLLLKLNDPLRAQEYIKKNPEIAQAPALNLVINSYSEMNKVVDSIRNSRTLTPQQKREKINAIGELQTEVAQKLLNNFKEENK